MIYELWYRALSPVHIGYKKIGFLKTTRYYITGKAMWGAITANLTRYLFENATADDYKSVGEFVKENIRATYFFPKVGNKIYNPKFTKEGLTYGDLPISEFEKRSIYSFVSTALDETKTADDGSLHETEYIKNNVKIDNKIENVSWIGYVFVNEHVESENFEVVLSNDSFIIETEEHKQVDALKFLDKVGVGGERNYGFGRMELMDLKGANKNKIFDYNLDGSTIKSPIALGHVEYSDNIEYMGEVEPLVGRNWNKKDGRNDRKIESEKGAGRELTFHDICFVPGTYFSGRKLVSFEIAEYGILRIIR